LHIIYGKNSMCKISICIPCYEMSGNGIKYLNELMKSIICQTYKNYEINITDHSENNEIEMYLKSKFMGSNILINYMRHNYKRGNSSANVNMGIKNSKGEIIKPMFQDDMFYDIDCLDKIIREYKNGNNWGAIGFNHISNANQIYNGIKHKPQFPKYTDDILQGYNELGCPSAIYFKNNDNFFDEELIWLMDCELFYRLHKKYGPPKLINEFLVSIRIWEKSISSQVRDNIEITQKEQKYVLEKHSDYILKPERLE
jgi:glycosyltransferase involved in cell wall biosynthesis